MRARVPKQNQHRARGVSLPPDLEAFAVKRASAADIGFSKYVQRLIALDLKRNLIKPLEVA